MRITIKTIIVALLLLLATQGAAFADLSDAAQGLLSKKYSEKIQATEAIAATGDARAAALLETLLGGDLYATKSDGRLVSREKVSDGYRISDIITEEDLGVVQSGDLSKITQLAAEFEQCCSN